ncbi:MAG: carbohydrate ABC transporter permease, partial [Oscillospiraceae bacterium]|nr:carbohydrate ABC transporter permease [Oscillospiraceae bacterium]
MAKYKTAGMLKGTTGLMIGLIIIFPLYYALSFSFMQYAEIVSYPPKFFPSSFSLDNYMQVFSTTPILRFILNSLIVCVCVISSQFLTASLAAYGFVFFDFPSKKPLFIAVLATMMIPGEAIIVSNFLAISSLGLLDNYLGLILPYGTSAMAIFLIR